MAQDSSIRPSARAKGAGASPNRHFLLLSSYCACKPSFPAQRTHARVAQLVEHSTDTRAVVGSNPTARTRLKTCIDAGFLLVRGAERCFASRKTASRDRDRTRPKGRVRVVIALSFVRAGAMFSVPENRRGGACVQRRTQVSF